VLTVGVKDDLEAETYKLLQKKKKKKKIEINISFY